VVRVRFFRRRTAPSDVVIRSAIEAMDVCAHGAPIASPCDACKLANAEHACPRCFTRFPTSASLLTHMNAHAANDWAPDDRVALTYEGTKMADENARYADPAEEDLPVAGRRPDAASAAPIDLPEVVEDPPAATTNSRMAAPSRADCPHCRGTGKTLTTNDLLRESVALIGQHGDDVVREFYHRLLDVAPGLAELFPSDLLGDDALKGQRDKLLQALVALATLYDPENSEQMAILDTHLATFGRSHGSFYRASEGVTRGATLDEYQAVKVVLFGTLHDFGEALWLSEYDTAWSAAYDYAAGAMLFHGMRSPVKSARYAR
jgi:hemoglobin-like flavoprotein